MVQPVAVEIVVQDPAGVRIAKAAGAQRVELCMALGVGGLSPSLGMIEGCVAQGLPVHVLIRPRPGGFIVDDEESAIIDRDIAAAIGAGASGVVIGALAEGAMALDCAAMGRWIATAKACDPAAEVTIHRCVDVLMGAGITPASLAQTLIDLGVTRVLTSGGAPKVGGGLDQLAALVQAVDGQVQVMAGGGLAFDDVATLRTIGVDAVHMSARMTTDHAGPSGPGGGADSFDCTDPEQVARLVALATQ